MYSFSSLLRHPTGEHLGSGSSLDASSSSGEGGGGGGSSSSSTLAAPVTVGIVLVLILLGAGIVFFRRSKCCDVTAIDCLVSKRTTGGKTVRIAIVVMYQRRYL